MTMKPIQCILQVRYFIEVVFTFQVLGILFIQSEGQTGREMI